MTLRGILRGRSHLKIPEALKDSVVVTAQLVADPHGTVYRDVSSLIYGHVKHTHHVDGDYSGPNFVIFFFLCVFSSSSSLVSSIYR